MTADNLPTRREVRIAIGLTAGLLFYVVLLGGLSHDPRSFDFAAFYAGGLIIRQGNASRLYDLGEQARIEREVLHREKFLIDNHPPFEALLFAALARLSYVKAYLLWGAMNVMFWLFFLQLLRPYTPIPRNSFRYLSLCALFPPLWAVLILGHTTVLLLLLFSLTFVCLKRGQDFNAGVCLGLGLFKFPLVLPFALICFLRSKWRLMAGFTAAASMLGVLSVIAVGLAGVRSYANLLIDIVRNPDKPAYESMRAWVEMPTVRGFFAALLTGRLSTVYISILTATVSAALLLFVAWRWRQDDRSRAGNSLSLMFAAALAVSQLTAPHMYGYDLTLMLLAVLLVIGSSQWSTESQERLILTAAMVILYTPPVYFLLLRWHALYIFAPVLAAFALAAISLARRAELSLT